MNRILQSTWGLYGLHGHWAEALFTKNFEKGADCDVIFVEREGRQVAEKPLSYRVGGWWAIYRLILVSFHSHTHTHIYIYIYIRYLLIQSGPVVSLHLQLWPALAQVCFLPIRFSLYMKWSLSCVFLSIIYIYIIPHILSHSRSPSCHPTIKFQYHPLRFRSYQGGPIAAAWTLLKVLGKKGFRSMAMEAVQASRALQNAIQGCY